MKIYTEVNYKWLDGQLVQTDSKSFEYEGKLSLCMPGAGGGGGGGNLLAVVDDIVKPLTEIDIDPRTSDSGNVLNPALTNIDLDPRTSDVNLGGGTLGQNLGNIDLDPRTSTLHPLDQPNLEQFGTGQGGTLGDITGGMAYYGDKINKEWIQAGLGYLGEKGQEVTDFVHGTTDTPTVTIDPDQSAYSGLTANKKAAQLAANKAKKQARSSLRINR